MANIFFTSDTHYGHANIIKYCNRPFNDVHEMDQELIRRHNEVVKPTDVVYHLGDFALAPNTYIESILNRLNGRIRFIKGNHDKFLTKLGNDGLALASTVGRLRNVEWIEDYYELREHGIVMFHYPLGSWNAMQHGTIMLHGHSHGNYKYSYPNSENHGKIIDVGVDCHDYRPISLDKVKSIAGNLNA